jgi:hypothetical protein
MAIIYAIKYMGVNQFYGAAEEQEIQINRVEKNIEKKTIQTIQTKYLFINIKTRKSHLHLTLTLALASFFHLPFNVI